MRSTGPLLAVGAVTVANQSIIGNDPIDWKVPIATGVAIGAFALLEKALPELAVGLSWLALVSVLFVRINGKPSPTENLLKWWEGVK
jgi:hypothetical protein